ncbi:MAG: phosphotransferase family protein [Porticoccaceae bacterium]
MILPADRLLELLEREIFQLAATDASNAEVSGLKSALVALRLLLSRERGGTAAMLAQYDGFSALLLDIRRRLPATASSAIQALAAIAESLVVARKETLTHLEATYRQALLDLETVLHDLRQEPSLSARTRADIIDIVAAWETQDLTAQLEEKKETADSDSAVTRTSLSDYLRDRFHDAALDVTSFQALPGGFGKQTYLFEVQGRELNGAFVMRRDYPVPLVDSDCHRIHHEYDVIRAVFQRGFPAPNALWLDTEHALLPGGDFIVMTRSPGVSGGTVITANTRVPADLDQTLATILGRLHALEPMEELAQLNEPINNRRWNLPLEHCVREYLQGWFGILRSSPHLPSPSLTAMLGWVMDNIPTSEGHPVLLHGDIGFHNFLFDEGRLTAVLDWEFAHLGDPAEDLANVRNNLGDDLDWENFMTCYRGAGGLDVPMSRIRFFQIWGHVRNAICAAVSAKVFIDGHADDMKFVLTPHIYIPHFIGAAQALIREVQAA